MRPAVPKESSPEATEGIDLATPSDNQQTTQYEIPNPAKPESLEGKTSIGAPSLVIEKDADGNRQYKYSDGTWAVVSPDGNKGRVVSPVNQNTGWQRMQGFGPDQADRYVVDTKLTSDGGREFQYPDHPERNFRMNPLAGSAIASRESTQSDNVTGFQSVDVDRKVDITPGSTSSTNESTDHSFHLRDYMLPVQDQIGSGACLYTAATGIAEWLLNKANGITNPTIGGPTDLSEQHTLGLGKRIGLTNPYTDAVDLLARGGYVRDEKLRFRAYADTSEWINWATPSANEADILHDLPPYQKHPLFDTGGEGSQHYNGVMRQEHLNRIKDFLRTHESPVLFVYKPPGANWWHANIITGFDDKRQTFTMRDSMFGKSVSDAPYPYAGGSRWQPTPERPLGYLGEFEMSYATVLSQGNHATGYTLTNDSQQIRTARTTPSTDVASNP